VPRTSVFIFSLPEALPTPMQPLCLFFFRDRIRVPIFRAFEACSPRQAFRTFQGDVLGKVSIAMQKDFERDRGKLA